MKVSWQKLLKKIPKHYQADGINDLRTAMAVINNYQNQLSIISAEVDAEAELAGVYKYFAGTPVIAPTQIGPAMLFENVKGYPNKRVLVGMLANHNSRVTRYIDR